MNTELIKYLITNFGFSTVILGIWYYCHKTWSHQITKLIDTQAENNKETFQLLKDMIDVNILQVGKLDKITELIHSNRWCPYLSKLSGRVKKGEEND